MYFVFLRFYKNEINITNNKTKKFGQLIEYKMKTIFLKKLFSKCGRESIPRPFSKETKSLDQ